ncbi:MAG: cation-translocating P-type ATPase [Oscillospiraceae bacterium]
MKLWQSMPPAEVLSALETTADGLSSAEAAQRLERDGPNKLEEGKKKTIVGIFLSQFADFMIWVLIAAALISGFLGEWVDAAIIAIVVILNAVMGTVQESKAEAALAALQAMSAPTAKVLRDGAAVKLPAAELVVGDVVLLEAGDSVPADLRLLESGSLKVEESALTGESVPVEKKAEALAAEDAPLGDRLNLAYLGTAVTYGRATGVVVGTGMHTEMGKIAHQLSSTEKETTPLQRKLNKLSNVLSYAVIAIAIIIFAVGVLRQQPWNQSFLTAVSLAVAAIPEGMVAVVTIVLAMGMQRMAGRGAIIRRLPAVETLGSTDVICSDKTGTLTLNRMTVQEEWTGGAPTERLYETMLHCNDAQAGEDGFVGDPTETALLDYLVDRGVCTAEDVKERVRAGEIPFDSDRKLSTVVLDLENGKKRVLVKGAPDVLIGRCDSQITPGGVAVLGDAAPIMIANETMAKRALRVLAFAYKDVDEVDVSDPADTESHLTFCGLVGMIDPPREEVKQAVAQCRAAGILPVMITGDHKVTASAIAQQLGILGDGRIAVTGADLEKMSDGELYEKVPEIAVYARVSPEHKSRIVAAWQKRGKIVSMTGDGVNDAPALKAADIGVGMGITGTDVSKGASDMVLTDDNFTTIVLAVREGRRIYDNIHKAVRFLLSSNCGEVLTMFAATVLGWTVLKPTHILWVNLVTDSLPALALGVEPEEPGVMDRPPRGKDTPFFSGRQWFRVLLTGLAEAVLTLAAFLLGRGTGIENLDVTMAFITLALLQLFATLGFQSEHSSLFKMKPREHPMLWLSLGAAVLLQLIVLFIPPLRLAFGLAVIPAVQWLEILGLCAIMLLVTEIQKWVARLRHED